MDADYLTDGIQGDTLKYKAYRLQAQVYIVAVDKRESKVSDYKVAIYQVQLK